jgi:chemotaxis protein MotB
MARKREDKKPSQAWMVTFSDTMTLLLCFFVMLLSFSSFDQRSLTRLEGVMDVDSLEAPTEIKKRIEDTERPTPRIFEVTQKGSMMPTELDPKITRHPKRRDPSFQDDVYKDRKVFYLPSEKLFMPRRPVWRGGGKERYLGKIAKLLKVYPCRVVVGESTDPAGGTADETSLRRAQMAMEYLILSTRLPKDLFNLSATDTGASGRFAGKPVLTVTLYSKEPFE